MRKFIYLTVLCTIFFTQTKAQFQSVIIGIKGLSCTQCPKNAETNFRKLAFVNDVRIDLLTNEAEITFNEGTRVDIEMLAKAVKDAGLSVNSIVAVFYFKPATITENYCMPFENKHYQFINTGGNKELSGLGRITFIGKSYMQKDDFKKWESKLESAKGKGCESDHVYYVTL